MTSSFFTISSSKGASIILSNLGIGTMGCFLFYMGREFFLWYYLIPYMASRAFRFLLLLSTNQFLVGESLVCFWPSRNEAIYLALYLFFTIGLSGSVSPVYSFTPFPMTKERLINTTSNLVMFTFLHHSDPTIPHYRKSAWSFVRGAAATVDRPLLGWMGRFFFHNISHDHVAHRMSHFILYSSLASFSPFLSHRFLFESSFLRVCPTNVYIIVGWSLCYL